MGKEIDDLLVCLVDMINQHCYVREGRESTDPTEWVYDSMAISANADAIRMLKKHGWAEIVNTNDEDSRWIFCKITRWE